MTVARRDSDMVAAVAGDSDTVMPGLVDRQRDSDTLTTNRKTTTLQHTSHVTHLGHTVK